MKKKPETLTAARFATVLRVVAELLDETNTDGIAEGLATAAEPPNLPPATLSELLKRRRRTKAAQASGEDEGESGDVGGALTLDPRPASNRDGPR
jgi:hypothetical protein